MERQTERREARSDSIKKEERRRGASGMGRKSRQEKNSEKENEKG